MQTIQRLNSPDNTLDGSFPLHQRRIKYDLDIGVSSVSDIPDVLDHGPGRRSDDSQPFHIKRDRLLIFRSKHSHFLQLCLQPFVRLIKPPCSVLQNLLGIKLIASAALIDADPAQHNHPLPVPHGKGEALSLPREHDAGHGSGFIFQ